MTPDERQPWELADESGEEIQEVPPTSEPIDETERGEAAEEDDGGEAGEEAAPRGEDEEEEPGTAETYGGGDAEEHGRQKGPAGGAGGPR